MNKISVAAPGKLMLLGEHAVLYNHPCIVTAVDQKMRAIVEVLDEPIFELQAPDVHIINYKKPVREVGLGEISKGAKFVEIAVANIVRNPQLSSKSEEILRNASNDNVGLRVTTKSEFSSQFGFGSSSAATVCAIKGVSEILGLNLSKREIFDLSYKTVLDIQGIGSGFDIAAAVFGGTLYFVTGGKVIEPLNINSLPLIVGYSGVKADTVSLINKVKESFENRQDSLNAIYNGIEVLVDQAKDALVKMDWQMLGKLMNKNQDLLVKLGVSIDKLDNMIKSALDAGAYGAKLSGAGGGDCMIAIVGNKNRQKVIEAIQRVGGEVINIKTDAEGVRVE